MIKILLAFARSIENGRKPSLWKYLNLYKLFWKQVWSLAHVFFEKKTLLGRFLGEHPNPKPCIGATLLSSVFAPWAANAGTRAGAAAVGR